MGLSPIYSEAELCDLLERLQLQHNTTVANKEAVHVTRDVCMVEDQGYQSDTLSESSSAGEQDPPSGCAYLQAIQSQLTHNYATSNGDYLDAIFTHRELFFAHPQGHRQCARGFSDLAGMIDRRPWRSDGDDDIEAAAAFRYEASMLAGSLR